MFECDKGPNGTGWMVVWGVPCGEDRPGGLRRMLWCGAVFEEGRGIV